MVNVTLCFLAIALFFIMISANNGFIQSIAFWAMLFCILESSGYFERKHNEKNKK